MLSNQTQTLRSIFYLGLVVVVSLLFACSAQDTTTQAEDELPPIEVTYNTAGKGLFMNTVTETQFIPKGYNYTHVTAISKPCLVEGVYYHSTFNEDSYDQQEAASMLNDLNVKGYNAVRVFINPECIMQANGNFSADYLNNVKHFLSQAKIYAVRVIVTLDQLPSVLYGDPIQIESDITWLNSQYFKQSDIDKEKTFWQDFITYLKNDGAPLDVIFSWELRNEFGFKTDLPPFTLTQGAYMAANGHAYDMSVEQNKYQLAVDGFIYWSREIRNAIHSVDPGSFVSVGFYASESIWNGIALSALASSDLDFVDLHLYPQPGVSFEHYVNYFGLNNAYSKPIIMGEFGAVESYGYSFDEQLVILQQWLINACQYGIQGGLLWTWDTIEGVQLSTQDEGLFYNALSYSVFEKGLQNCQ